MAWRSAQLRARVLACVRLLLQTDALAQVEGVLQDMDALRDAVNDESEATQESQQQQVRSRVSSTYHKASLTQAHHNVCGVNSTVISKPRLLLSNAVLQQHTALSTPSTPLRWAAWTCACRQRRPS